MAPDLEAGTPRAASVGHPEALSRAAGHGQGPAVEARLHGQLGLLMFRTWGNTRRFRQLEPTKDRSDTYFLEKSLRSWTSH